MGLFFSKLCECYYRLARRSDFIIIRNITRVNESEFAIHILLFAFRYFKTMDHVDSDAPLGIFGWVSRSIISVFADVM